MATFTRRGDGQWQVKVRRRGYPAITKTFSTKAKAEYWARSVESEMDGGTFVSRAEAETTTQIHPFTPKTVGGVSGK